MRNMLAFSLLATLVTTAFGQAKLTGITTTKVGDGLTIAIQGDGLTDPKVYKVNKNSSFIVEFRAQLAGKFGREKIEYAGVQYVQYGWYKARPAIVRVHVKTDGLIAPELSQINGEWVVTVGTATTALNIHQPIAATDSKTVDLKDIELENSAEMTRAEKALSIEPQKETVAKTEPEITATAKAVTQEVKLEKTQGSAGSLSTDIERKPVLPALPRNDDKTVLVPKSRKSLVSLDFVGTDVVQILKALSIQAGVNIVTSPDVSPSDKPLKLSITLNNVELDSALSLVTASAKLRYARVGETYVVALADSFPAMMRQLMQRNAVNNQTRVVNLVSGEAAEIKESVLKAFPPEGDGGYYEIIVPGSTEASQVAPQNVQTPTDPGQTDPSAGAQDPNAKQAGGVVGHDTSKRSYYLLLVGDPSRVSTVETYIHELDAKVAASFSINSARNVSTVAIPIQSGQTQRIKEMIEKLLVGNPRASDYSITESAVKELQEGEQSIKFLLMIGPDAELQTLKTFALGLDRELCKPLGITYAENPETMVRDYEVVELKYLEPIIAAQDLKGRFKDLWATVVPDNVTPGLKGEGEFKKDEAPTDPANAAGQNGGSKTESRLKKELGHEPMRLMLRGSRTTIEEAKKYLSLVDVAPRQIALEMRVMEMTREQALNFGLDWNLNLGGTGTVKLLNSPGSSNSVGGTIGGLSVTAALDSLANNRNLIARPNALVTDGREAHLFVGDTIRYVKQVQATQSGITVITDEIQVGSQFDIKARIGSEGSIALDLAQKFTLLSAFLDIPGGGKLPQTSDRSSNLFVNMKSGETIAIGGLILDTDIKNYSGVPFLKDLPIIGRLFGKTSNSKSRTEIVFFLTAVEVDSSNRAGAASPSVNFKRNPDPVGEYKKTGKNDK